MKAIAHASCVTALLVLALIPLSAEESIPNPAPEDTNHVPAPPVRPPSNVPTPALVPNGSEQPKMEHQALTEFKESFVHNQDRIVIEIKQTNFNPKNHSLHAKNWKIDGVTPYGVDGYEVHPVKEISDFTIKWNGNLIPMPGEMYRDCYSPDLKKSAVCDYIGGDLERGQAPSTPGITVRWDEKDDMLQITMVSIEWVSAPYFVVWKISRYGVHSRRVVCLGS